MTVDLSGKDTSMAPETETSAALVSQIEAMQ